MSTVAPGYTPAQISAEALRSELLIRTLLMEIRTAVPVKVVNVHSGTGSPPTVGTVDVQPLIQTEDGNGKLWSVEEVYGAPFIRFQAGGNAVVIDPQVGDLGMAVSCDRDISSVIASGGQLSGPGSDRTHHISDLIYVASIFSAATLAQWIWFNGSNLTVFSPGTITLQAQQIDLVGPVSQTNGNVSMQTKLTVPNVDATTDVTVPNGSVNNHVHGGVTSGGSNTGGMTG